jgi:hypothetical protein
MAKQLDYVGVYLHLQRNEDGSYTKTLQRVESVVRDPAATTVPENVATPFHAFPAYDGAATVSAFLDTCLQSAKDKAGVS